MRLARGGKPLESQIKVPKNENRQYIYARHPEMGILKSRVSRLPQSEVTYYDIMPFYYITLSGNLVEKVMKDPNVINLIEEDLIQWLQIPSVQDEANARKQIRFLINDHVAYPSDYRNTILQMDLMIWLVFFLLIKLAVVDLDKTAKL